jgi:hypothetical protein
MNIIRKANISDAAQFVRIKNHLQMPETEETNSGGFLLGTNEATYQFLIQNALCLVSEQEGEVVGFGIAFSDAVVKSSELWQKRHFATWYADILPELSEKSICYFDQLAFLPNMRKSSVELAFHLIHQLFADGHDFLLATTVRKPILNLAAVPFIKAVGGAIVGNINEYYEGVGEINSDIYLIRKSDYLEKVRKFNFFEKYKEKKIVT